MEYFPIVGNTLHRDTSYRRKKDSVELSTVRGSSCLRGIVAIVSHRPGCTNYANSSCLRGIVASIT